MRLRRLSWAGIEVSEGNWRVLIDPLEDTLPFRKFAGPPRSALVPVTVDDRTCAAVTHIHRDHCDRRLLARLPAGQVICHSEIAAALNEEGVTATGVDLWKTTSIGPFRMTPVPAQDWRSDDQVAWVIESGGQRIHSLRRHDLAWPVVRDRPALRVIRRCLPSDQRLRRTARRLHSDRRSRLADARTGGRGGSCPSCRDGLRHPPHALRQPALLRSATPRRGSLPRGRKPPRRPRDHPRRWGGRRAAEVEKRKRRGGLTCVVARAADEACPSRA